MSIEAALAELTAAVKENTAAHLKLAAVATAAAGGKAAKTEAPAEEASKADAKKPAAKAEAAKAEKPAAKPAAKKAKPAPVLTVAEEDIPAVATKFLASDDEAERTARKGKMRAALDHLGFGRATEIDNDEGRAKFATYVAYWTAGHEVDFEEIDALVAEALGEADGGEGGEDDDMV